MLRPSRGNLLRMSPTPGPIYNDFPRAGSMKSGFGPLLISLLLLSGCSKQAPQASSSQKAPDDSNTIAAVESNTPAPSDQNQPTAPEVPLPPPPPPSPVVKARALDGVRQNVVGDVDPQLTEELRNFIQQKKRMPQTFSEFATLRLDSIPRPPAGKKWAIDSESIEVKAVAAQ